MAHDRNAVRKILDQAKAAARRALTAPEAGGICEAYGIAVPKETLRASGIVKPVVASLAGDVEVEQAAEFLYQHGIPAYAYSTEIPVAVLGAKYRWARGAGLIPAI